jgi:tRNA threonylcarbamoyladenosine modification (KEOPS) complex  Pcc1 subunit
MNELIFTVEASPEAAEAVLKSVAPELSENARERSKAELSYDGGLSLHITSDDLHSMRAAVNTYLRWLDMALNLTSLGR